MTDTTTASQLTTKQQVCPWCGTEIDSDSSSVTVGPPPFDRGSTTHAWTLHADCADEWEATISRLHELSNRGARKTLIEYPIEHGPESLRESCTTNK